MSSVPEPTTAVTVFNGLSQEQATARLATCLKAPGWAGAVLAQRPYPDRETLLSTAYRLGVALDAADLRSALSAHPQIGERPGGAGREAEHSRAEQGGVDAEDEELARQLRAGNIAYDQKFGQVFLIRAAGRSGPEILAALTRRLANDPDTEALVVLDQLAQIAQLRLGLWLDELAEIPEQ